MKELAVDVEQVLRTALVGTCEEVLDLLGRKPKRSKKALYSELRPILLRTVRYCRNDACFDEAEAPEGAAPLLPEQVVDALRRDGAEGLIAHRLVGHRDPAGLGFPRQEAARIAANLKALQVGLGTKRDEVEKAFSYSGFPSSDLGALDVFFVIGSALLTRKDRWVRTVLLDMLREGQDRFDVPVLGDSLLDRAREMHPEWSDAIDTAINESIVHYRLSHHGCGYDHYSSDMVATMCKGLGEARILNAFQHVDREVLHWSPIAMPIARGGVLRLVEEGEVSRGALLSVTLRQLVMPHKTSIARSWQAFWEELEVSDAETVAHAEAIARLAGAPAAGAVKIAFDLVPGLVAQGTLSQRAAAMAWLTATQQRGKTLSKKAARGLASALLKEPTLWNEFEEEFLDLLHHPLHEVVDITLGALEKGLAEHLSEVGRCQAEEGLAEMSTDAQRKLRRLLSVEEPVASGPSGPGAGTSLVQDALGRSAQVPLSEVERAWRDVLEDRQSRMPTRPRAAHETVALARAFEVPSLEETLILLSQGPSYRSSNRGYEQLLAGIAAHQAPLEHPKAEALLEPATQYAGTSMRPELLHTSAELVKANADHALDVDRGIKLLICAWATGDIPTHLSDATSVLVANRPQQLAHLITGTGCRQPLAQPTHEGGWVDPLILATRYLELPQEQRCAADAKVALRRMPEGPRREDAWNRIRDEVIRMDDPVSRALCIALGPVELASERLVASVTALRPMAPPLREQVDRCYTVLSSEAREHAEELDLLLTAVETRCGLTDFTDTFPYLGTDEAFALLSSSVVMSREELSPSSLSATLLLHPRPIQEDENWEIRGWRLVPASYLLPLHRLHSGNSSYGYAITDDMDDLLWETPRLAQFTFDCAAAMPVYEDQHLRSHSHLVVGQRPGIDISGGVDSAAQQLAHQYPINRDRGAGLLSTWLLDGRLSPDAAANALCRMLVERGDGKGLKHATDGLRLLAAQSEVCAQIALEGMGRALGESDSPLGARAASGVLAFASELVREGAGPSQRVREAIGTWAEGPKDNAARKKARLLVRLVDEAGAGAMSEEELTARLLLWSLESKADG